MKKILLIFLLFVIPAHASEYPVPREVISPKGIKAWLIESDRLPLITMRVAFRGGVEQDEMEKQGLSTLAVSLLTQGAGPYDAAGFQNRLASHSIQLDWSAGRDFIDGTMKTLKRTKGEAFKLLALSLANPRFSPDDFARVLETQRTASRLQESNPGWQGRYALNRAIFGDHPYAFRALGNERTLKAITLEDVKRFPKERFAKNNLIVVIVGAISVPEVARMLDQVFGDLPEEPKLSAIRSVTPKTQEPVLVEREGTQTQVFWAAPAPPYHDPDFAAVEIASEVLGGGGFSSRLMESLRVDKGLTYGVGMGLAPMEASSIMVGQFSSNNDVLDQSVDLLRATWDSFYDKGLTEAELETARQALLGQMRLSMTSTDAIAGAYVSLLKRREGPNGYDQLEQALRSVSQDKIMSVIKKWFNPEMATYVFVGKKDGLSVRDGQETGGER